mgnify:FL=1
MSYRKKKQQHICQSYHTCLYKRHIVLSIDFKSPHGKIVYQQHIVFEPMKNKKNKNNGKNKRF